VRKRRVKKGEPECTRREALYAHIIGRLLHANRFPGPRPADYNDYCRKERTFYISEVFLKGDLILTTGGLWNNPNPWNVGYCVEKHSEHEVVILDIFSGTECNYGNESYVALHNLPFHLTMNDKQYALYQRFLRAIDAVDPYRDDFRVANAIPLPPGGVRFYTRVKWETERTAHDISFRMRSRDMRACLEEILKERKT